MLPKDIIHYLQEWIHTAYMQNFKRPKTCKTLVRYDGSIVTFANHKELDDFQYIADLAPDENVSRCNNELSLSKILLKAMHRLFQVEELKQAGQPIQMINEMQLCSQGQNLVYSTLLSVPRTCNNLRKTKEMTIDLDPFRALFNLSFACQTV